MKEFFDQVEILLTGFPPKLLSILISLIGALCAAIVIGLTSNVPTSLKRVLGQFFVGWMTGIFGGALVSPVFTSTNAVSFFSGAGGYISLRKYLNEKEKENTTKPPVTGSEP